VVWDLPNGAETVPMLPAEQWKAIGDVERKWGELCRTAAGRYQLPDGWLQAMIWRESGGNQWARNRENTDDPRDDGIGLMQITSRALKANLADAQLFDPRTNIETGARYIGWLASLQSTHGPDGKADFARIAAAFNAGSVRPSTENRWGMHSTGSHIDQEVRAYNTWVYLKLEGEKFYAAQALAKSFTVPELLGPDFDQPAGIDNGPDTPKNDV